MSEAEKPIIGVWDQWCVMSALPYVKVITTETGDEIEQTSLLDLNVCKQIVRNFGLSKDDLPCTLGHQQTTPDKARFKTATYSALAVWHQGQVVEFAAHGPIERPTEADLPRADNGQRPEDGIYAYRKTVTELGAAIVQHKAVGKTSPEFVMDSRNQQNESIGPQALGLAWTDDPFLNGCEINLERFPQMRKYTTMQHRWESLRQRKGMEMNRLQDVRNEEIALVADLRDAQRNADDAARRGDSANSAAWGQKAQQLRTRIDRVLQDIRQEENMKTYEAEAGVEEKDSPEQKYGKIKAHFGRKALMEAGVQDADTPDVALGKFAKHMECHEAACKMEAAPHSEPDADDKDKQKMEGPTVMPGAPTYVDPGKPSDVVVGGHKMETTEALAYEVKRLRGQVEQQSKVLHAYEAKDKRQTAQSQVTEAWRQGRIVPLPGESAAQAQSRFLVKYERDPKLFEADLAPVGTNVLPGGLDMQLTRAGLPVAFERDGSAVDFGGRNPDEEIIARADAIKAKNPKLTNAQAAAKVLLESPHLGSSYVSQSRRALLS